SRSSRFFRYNYYIDYLFNKSATHNIYTLSLHERSSDLLQHTRYLVKIALLLVSHHPLNSLNGICAENLVCFLHNFWTYLCLYNGNTFVRGHFHNHTSHHTFYATFRQRRGIKRYVVVYKYIGYQAFAHITFLIEKKPFIESKFLFVYFR